MFACVLMGSSRSTPGGMGPPRLGLEAAPREPAVCPQQQYQNGESEESHAQFLKALQNAVTTFVNRMKSNHVRGRSITNDSAVLSLFQSINGMHPRLLELLNQLDERRRRCRQLPGGPIGVGSWERSVPAARGGRGDGSSGGNPPGQQLLESASLGRGQRGRSQRWEAAWRA